MAASVAMNAHEAMRKHAAFEISAQLPLDESSRRCAARASIGEESLELLSDDLMEEALLRLPAFDLGHANPMRDRD